jgi:hypothetical protein
LRVLRHRQLRSLLQTLFSSRVKQYTRLAQNKGTYRIS